MLNSRLQQALSDLLVESMTLLTPTELELVKRLKSFEEERCYKTYTRDQLSYLEYLVKGKEREPQASDALREIEKAMQQKLQFAVEKEQFNGKTKHPVNREQIESIMKERKVRQIRFQKNLLEKELYKINRSIQRAQFNHQLQEKAESEDQERNAPKLNVGSKTVRENPTQEQANKQKQVSDFIQQLHKDRLERKKKIEESLKMVADRQNQKREEELKQERELLQQRKQQIIERKKRMQQLRQKERVARSQHELSFATKISKSFSVQEQQKHLEQLRIEQQKQLRKKLMTRREKLNLQPLDSTKLEEHSRRYEQYKQKEEQKRQERLKLQQEETEHDLVKHYSSYDKHRSFIESAADSDRQPVRMKVQRMKDYQALIRSKYQPKVDESKRKQLQNQIEELELGGKHIRRSRLENGSILFEQIHRSDPKIIGLQYLQEMKKVVEKSRSLRKPQEASSQLQTMPKTNYLAELRQKNRKKVDYLGELDRFETYDAKVKAVQHRTDLLLEEAKRKQMLLKHGKFLTPAQILQYKEELDGQYLDIINMKLKLIQ